MASYESINCNYYDYLEIACMDRYAIELQLPEQSVTGRADQLLTHNRQEFLVLVHEDGSDTRIRVDRIKHLRVISRPARFTEVRFAE